MHTSSRSVATPLPDARAVRSPSALPGDAKRELKEELDHFHACAEYAAERLASAPASEPLQFTCTLRVPALVKPGGEVLLKECSFTALGRGKGEAEQKCAQQALAHIAKLAPHLHAKEA
ncbi:hypothetical protein ABPG75_000349 [Micractinium tetrahymenae]